MLSWPGGAGADDEHLLLRVALVCVGTCLGYGHESGLLSGTLMGHSSLWRKHIRRARVHLRGGTLRRADHCLARMS